MNDAEPQLTDNNGFTGPDRYTPGNFEHNPEVKESPRVPIPAQTLREYRIDRSDTQHQESVVRPPAPRVSETMQANFEKLRNMTPDEMKAMQEEKVRAQRASEVPQPVSIKPEKKGFFARILSIFSRKSDSHDTSQPTMTPGTSVPEPA